MKREPFGTTSIPFLFAATINYHLHKMSSQFADSVARLEGCIYVDDILTGAETISEALKLLSEATTLFATALMKLHKWASNDKTLLENLRLKQTCEELPLGQALGLIKVLGLVWQADTDELAFSPESVTDFVQRRHDTERFVLQATSRLYDPLGFLAPFTIRAKVCFQ